MYQINYLAVIVMAIAYFAIGAIWYSPALFGKAWMEALGKSAEEIKAGAGPKLYIGAFIGALVLCYIMAYFVKYVNATTFWGGVITGFAAWVGFVATVMGMNALFQGTSGRLYIIDAGYALVGMILAGGVLAVW